MDFHPHFSEAILEHSQVAARAGIDNTIPAALRPNALYLSHWLGQCEEKLQAKWPGVRLYMSSGFRCPTLNGHKDVGGSNTSYHKLALAADLYAVWARAKITALMLAQALKEVVSDFDKLILEFGAWVHLQLSQPGQAPRGECLTAKKERTGKNEFKTIYLQGFVA